MSGCVTKIVERNMVLDIPKSPLCKEFSAFDSNDDGTLEVDDLLRVDGFIQEGSAAPAMQSFVVTVLSHSGVIQPSQEAQFRNLFNLFNRVHEIHDAVIGRSDSWEKKHIDTWGREMEFETAYWNNSVLPLVKDGGLLSNCYGLSIIHGAKAATAKNQDYGLGHQLSLEMFYVLDSLAGVKKKTVGGGCMASKTFYDVNVTNLPIIFEAPVKMMIDKYNSVVNFFDSYREVECDAEGCPADDQYALYDTDPFRYKMP